MQHIECRNIDRIFQEGTSERVVLKDLNLTIERGEFIALLGRSGSGKTTLLNVLSGIDLPNGGDVVIDKVLVNGLNERSRTLFRRQYLGFVFQSFNLIPTLTVEENLMLPLELMHFKRKDAKERVEGLLSKVALSDRANAFPDQLSGGEQQRVAIARAVVHKPQVVLADEPTGNLDDQSATMAMSLLSDLVRKQESTLIIATHSSEVATMATRRVRLSQGHIEEMQ